jgi:hypothetical protein
MSSKLLISFKRADRLAGITKNPIILIRIRRNYRYIDIALSRGVGGMASFGAGVR